MARLTGNGDDLVIGFGWILGQADSFSFSSQREREGGWWCIFFFFFGTNEKYYLGNRIVCIFFDATFVR